MSKILKYITWVFAFFVLLVVVEHTLKVNQITYKPSVFFQYCADKFSDFFWSIGKIWADISSFLTLLDLKDLLKTLDDLVTPLWKFFLSPLYIFKGYAEEAMTYVNKVGLVYIGSFALVVLAIYLGNRYELIDMNKWTNKIADTLYGDLDTSNKTNKTNKNYGQSHDKADKANKTN